MTHSLTLGPLVLTGDPAFADDDHGFWFEVAAEGTEFGTPEAVTRIVTSLLLDGAIVTYDRDGNRVIPVRVLVHGPTLAAVAQGEAALRRESKKRNELTWQPPDNFAPPSVFDTYPSPFARDYGGAWDLAEMRFERVVPLNLTCAPYARSADMVTVEALEVPGSETLVNIDTCDSATGWSATSNGSAAPVSTTWAAGAVSVFELLVAGGQTLTLTRTGSVDFSASRYLKVDIGYRANLGALPVTCTTNTGAVLPVLDQRLVSPGRFIYTYDTGGVTVSSLTFTSVTTADTADLKIHNVARTDMPPAITPRQSTRIINPGGTERTPASIHVEATTGVDGHGGLTIVHTCPEDGSGYSPPLRRWRTSASTGPETTDAAALSGKWEPIAFEAGGFYAEVPTSALPEGGYVLMARLRSATAAVNEATIFWSTSTIFPDTTTQQGFTNGHVKVSLPGTAPTFVPVAALSLPSVRTRAGKVQIVLQAITSSGPQVELDEAWLFRADDDCALTIVHHWWSHLWLDSPDVTSPVPRVWMGDDRGTQVHPGDALVAMGNHVLHPNGTAVFTASLSNYPATEASFYRRWPNNAAE